MNEKYFKIKRKFQPSSSNGNLTIAGDKIGGEIEKSAWKHFSSGDTNASLEAKDIAAAVGGLMHKITYITVGCPMVACNNFLKI